MELDRFLIVICLMLGLRLLIALREPKMEVCASKISHFIFVYDLPVCCFMCKVLFVLTRIIIRSCPQFNIRSIISLYVSMCNYRHWNVARCVRC